MMSPKTKETTVNQRGIVSIIVTLIIMLVLTLIVTGFAQLARREQREALDRQLSTAAQYAVESGINAAIAQINSEIDSPGGVTEVSDCGSFDVSRIGSDTIKPTCVLIDPKPPTLVYQDVSTDDSTIAPIRSGEGGSVGRLVVSWQDKDNGQAIKHNSTPGNPFLPIANWNDGGQNKIGVLRVDLVPVDGAGADLNNLRSSMFTAFLVPTSQSGVAGRVTYSDGIGSEQGAVVYANCSNAPASGLRKCSVTVSGLDAHEYYIRMKSIYTASNVQLCIGDGTCNPDKTMIKAQAVIDVTAKASDVLKRLQVRVSTDPQGRASGVIPEYALDSKSDVCKLISAAPDEIRRTACP